jgi:hypothetical protein
MKKILFSLILILTAFSITAHPALAKVVASEEGTVTVAKSEVINDDLFIGAKAVSINGTVNGDIFIGAETVNIDGVINGNLHVGASSVYLSGQVKGSVYIGAGSVNVSGAAVDRSLIIGSGNANLDKSTTVGGTVIAGAGNLMLNSTVKRHVIMGAGDAVLGPETKIQRDLYYAVGNEDGELNIPSSASISGNVFKPEEEINMPKKEEAERQLNSAIKGAKIGVAVGGLLSALLIGYLYLTFFGGHFVKTSEYLSANFWKSLGFGFLVIIMALPALILMAVTLIGIPLAGITFLVLLIYWYLAKIIVAMSLGKWLMSKFNAKKSGQFMAFALGLFILYLLKFVPIVSVFAGMITLWSGLGALALNTLSRKEKTN